MTGLTLKTELTAEERDALNELGRSGIMKRRIEDHVRETLLQKRLIETKVGGLAITSAGRKALKKK
jgi:hypothetical protein|tara:strand:+ start:493 stop:690 length:198 start_codon:yes stop_codon:yes gene_type:complete